MLSLAGEEFELCTKISFHSPEVWHKSIAAICAQPTQRYGILSRPLLKKNA